MISCSLPTRRASNAVPCLVRVVVTGGDRSLHRAGERLAGGPVALDHVVEVQAGTGSRRRAAGVGERLELGDLLGHPRDLVRGPHRSVAQHEVHHEDGHLNGLVRHGRQHHLHQLAAAVVEDLLRRRLGDHQSFLPARASQREQMSRYRSWK